jgi:V/A-type H+/Na+-transporting ATPase subunit A
LSSKEQVTLDTAKALREDYLQQFAFDEVDGYTPPKRMYLMLKAILTFHDAATDAVEKGALVKDITNLDVKDKIARSKTETDESALTALQKESVEQIKSTINPAA